MYYFFGLLLEGDKLDVIHLHCPRNGAVPRYEPNVDLGGEQIARFRGPEADKRLVPTDLDERWGHAGDVGIHIYALRVEPIPGLAAAAVAVNVEQDDENRPGRAVRAVDEGAEVVGCPRARGNALVDAKGAEVAVGVPDTQDVTGKWGRDHVEELNVEFEQQVLVAALFGYGPGAHSGSHGKPGLEVAVDKELSAAGAAETGTMCGGRGRSRGGACGCGCC